MTTTWLGIDPGADGTGIALIRTGTRPVTLLDHDVILNDTGEVGTVYIARVLGAIDRIRCAHFDATTDSGRPRMAVEAVNSPTGFAGGKRHPIDPAHLLGCAIVLGAVLAAYPDSVLVPPGGNGHGAYASYPPELVTAGERRRADWSTRPAGQSTDLRHARSAFDVARQGPRCARRNRLAHLTRQEPLL